MKSARIAAWVSLWALMTAAFQTHADATITPESIHIQRCSACHYVDGRSADGQFPNIAGQYELYLNKALKQFKDNQRESEAMELIASLHKQQELVILANYYANQKPAAAPPSELADPSLRARGQRLFHEERVYGIACVDCHGPDAKGYVRSSPRSSVSRAIPRLAGQRAPYLKAVMEKYQEGRVTSGMCAMRKAAKTLKSQDIDALIAFLSSQ